MKLFGLTILFAYFTTQIAAAPFDVPSNSSCPSTSVPSPANSNPTALEQDFDELNYAAKLSAAAYAGCQGKVEDVVITTQLNDQATGAQGFIGYTVLRKRILLSIRGSDQLEDYINDLDIIPVPVSKLKGCESVPKKATVMQGIFKPWAAIHDSVVGNITQLIQQYPDYDLEVTGHSLGGSTTYLAFVTLAMNFPTKSINANALAAFPIANEAFAQFASTLLANPQPIDNKTLPANVAAGSTPGFFSSIFSSFKSWLSSLRSHSKNSKARLLMEMEAPTPPLRILRRGTEAGDGVPNMFSKPASSSSSSLALLHHFGTEFYYTGPTQLSSSQMNSNAERTVGAASTTMCVGERDTRCSAGDNAVGPTKEHHEIFGVEVTYKGDAICAASGGAVGANGGSRRRVRRRGGGEW